MSRRRELPPLNGNLVADTSIRQPIFVSMLMLLFLVLGFLGYNTMPVNLLPDIETGVVTVSVTYPGANQETIAEQVAKPIEDQLATISGVNEISSNSSEGRTVISVQFDTEIDTVLAAQDVREKVTAIRDQLPLDIEEPVYERVDPNGAPILTLAVTGAEGQDGRALRTLIDQQIVPRIQRGEGVGSVTLSGGLERQINVDLNLQRLQALRILPSDVSQAIAGAATDIGLGNTRVGAAEVDLRAPSVFQSPADVLRVGIGNTGYTVRDVATVSDATAEVEQYARYNGQDAVIIDIRKQSDTNTVAVADAALREVERAFVDFPELRYEIVVDEAEQVRTNINGALEEILFAVTFALLVVMLFFSGLRAVLLSAALPMVLMVLGLTVFYDYAIYLIGAAAALLLVIAFFSSRNTAVTILGLPVILIATFAVMSVFGVTINILSLLAISVATGLVIDDAIVVRENIFRSIERGENHIVAASKGTAQVATSVLAMTLTIIVVFVPATFTTGTAGILLRSFGITIAAAMAISLIEAFTMAPATAAYWSGDQRQHKAPQRKPGEEHLPDEALEEGGWLERWYGSLLRWTLHHRLLMAGIAAAVVVLSVVAAQGVKFGFIPATDQHRFGVGIELPPGTPLNETDRTAREVEQRLMNAEYVRGVLATVGGVTAGGGGGAEQATFVVLLDEKVGTLEAQPALRELLNDVPGLAFSIPSCCFGTQTDVTARPLQVQLRAPGDLAELEPIATTLVEQFRTIPGLQDIDTTYTPGKPQLRYELIPERANDYGLTNQTLAASLRALVDGDTAAAYRESGEEYDIVVQLRPEDRATIDELRNVRLPLGEQLVPVASIAAVEEASAPTSIRRADRQTEIIIGGNNVGRNQNDVQADMQAVIDQLELPPGVVVGFGGQTDDQNETIVQILTAMVLSVTLVYMVLASQFASLGQPLIIMLAMPLSFIGAFLAVRLTGQELDAFGFLGMIMLLGLVVKNSILLVDFTNNLQAVGLAKDEALVRAGMVRLRPILMTSISLIFGALPAAIGLGEGAEQRRGLATVVIGGVLTSTMLTLLLIPVAYSALQSWTDRLDARKDARRAQKQARRAAHTATSDAPAPPIAPDLASQPDNGATHAEDDLVAIGQNHDPQHDANETHRVPIDQTRS
jgi:hydrophobic/amphiphilic exporter-1 (mainly G- bacteria), HAE1 family